MDLKTLSSNNICSLNCEDDRLGDLYEALDALHTAASTGQLETQTSLNERDLIGLLRDMMYTAQETIQEIEKNRPRRDPILRLVQPDAQPGKRQA